MDDSKSMLAIQLDPQSHPGQQHRDHGPEQCSCNYGAPIVDWRHFDTGYAVNPEKNELIHREKCEDRSSELLHWEYSHQEMKANSYKNNETQCKRVLPEYRSLRHIENDADDPR